MNIEIALPRPRVKSASDFAVVHANSLHVWVWAQEPMRGRRTILQIEYSLIKRTIESEILPSCHSEKRG